MPQPPNLVIVYRMLTTPEYPQPSGAEPLAAPYLWPRSNLDWGWRIKQPATPA